MEQKALFLTISGNQTKTSYLILKTLLKKQKLHDIHERKVSPTDLKVEF